MFLFSSEKLLGTLHSIKTDLANFNFTGSFSSYENPPNVFDRHEQYFDSDIFSDVIFKFDSELKIKASSMFLAIKSSHFKK